MTHYHLLNHNPSLNLRIHRAQLLHQHQHVIGDQLAAARVHAQLVAFPHAKRAALVWKNNFSLGLQFRRPIDKSGHERPWHNCGCFECHVLAVYR